LWLRLAGFGAVLGAAGVVVAIVAGPQILALLYGPAYAAESDLLVWTMVTAGAGYVASFSGYAVTAARYYRSQIPLFALVAATNAFACYVFVPWMGLRGAALALGIAMAVQLIGSVAIVAHFLYARTVVSPP
jgi:O-antigen/teichoic acid export membrane protein